MLDGGDDAVRREGAEGQRAGGSLVDGHLSGALASDPAGEFRLPGTRLFGVPTD